MDIWSSAQVYGQTLKIFKSVEDALVFDREMVGSSQDDEFVVFDDEIVVGREEWKGMDRS